MTDLQLKILQAIADGVSDSTIASELFYAESNIKKEIRKILNELQAKNRVHAAAIGIRTKLID